MNMRHYDEGYELAVELLDLGVIECDLGMDPNDIDDEDIMARLDDGLGYWDEDAIDGFRDALAALA